VVPEPEVWIDEGPAGGAAAARSSSRRGRSAPSPSRKPAERRERVRVRAPQLVELVGARRAERLESRLGDAATAFAGDRYGEARQILSPIVREVPDLAEARELYGLTLYRLGRWKEAARELDAFVELSGGSTEQHPVLADCRRALRQYGEVDRLWEELRESSPSGALVTEGRIVAAGALADRGDLAGAVRLLGKGFRFPKRPQEHHLRRAYALADLYERSGDLPQARVLFSQLLRTDPEFLDVAERLAGLD
jgi:tetratricopeptide (TPR) repeat protein